MVAILIAIFIAICLALPLLAGTPTSRAPGAVAEKAPGIDFEGQSFKFMIT